MDKTQRVIGRADAKTLGLITDMMADVFLPTQKQERGWGAWTVQARVRAPGNVRFQARLGDGPFVERDVQLDTAALAAALANLQSGWNVNASWAGTNMVYLVLDVRPDGTLAIPGGSVISEGPALMEDLKAGVKKISGTVHCSQGGWAPTAGANGGGSNEDDTSEFDDDNA